MDDGTCEVAGKSVGAIIIKSGCVLLAWREANGIKKLALPGGRLGVGETPEQTLTRLVYNETGLVVRPVTLAGFHFSPDDWFPAFNCEIESGELRADGGAIYMGVDEALSNRDVSELTRLMLAGRERALEKDVMYDVKNKGCSLYL